MSDQTIDEFLHPRLDPQELALVSAFVGSELSNDEAQEILKDKRLFASFERWTRGNNLVRDLYEEMYGKTPRPLQGEPQKG